MFALTMCPYGQCKKNAGISLMALMPVIIICVGRECHSVTNSKPKKFNLKIIFLVY